MVGLFGGVALAATGYIPVFSMAPLVAEDLLGATTWSGLPGAVAIGGSAVGASLLSLAMDRTSRKAGLLGGFVVAALAAALAGVAVRTGIFALFLVAVFFFGFGVVARHLARYAAGDLVRPERRARAISFIVWAGTVGSVLGPLLLGPAQATAETLDLPGLVGPMAVAALALSLAVVVLAAVLPPLPERGASIPPTSAPATDPPGAGIRGLLAEPRTAFALVSLMVGQFVMVLLMSMTPVHMRHGGEDLSAVGLVFAAHTLGMFALSPLTGALADAWGRIPVILLGQGMLLVAAALAAPTHGADRLVLVIALFLLGLGWNFGFVAGSALVSESVPANRRLKVEGLADTVVWTTAAGANLSSGLLLGIGGYVTLGIVGAVLSLAPATLRWALRRRG